MMERDCGKNSNSGLRLDCLTNRLKSKRPTPKGIGPMDLDKCLNFRKKFKVFGRQLFQRFFQIFHVAKKSVFVCLKGQRPTVTFSNSCCLKNRSRYFVVKYYQKSKSIGQISMEWFRFPINSRIRFGFPGDGPFQ